MLRGGNMRFRPAIFIWFVFAQSFFKLHKNDENRKLKAWSFRLRKNDFCRLYNERARALQSSITFFFDTPCSYNYDCMYCSDNLYFLCYVTYQVANCKLPFKSEIYSCKYIKLNKVLIIIIYMYRVSQKRVSMFNLLYY